VSLLGLSAVLVVLLVVAHDGCGHREDTGEEVVRHQGDDDAHDHGQLTEVAEMRATDAGQHLLGHGVRGDGGLLGELQRVQFVCFFEEVRGDGGGVHGDDVDAAGAHFNGQGGGELGDEGLGGTVHHRERVGDVAGWGRSEDEAALQLLVQHQLQEMVSHFDAGSGIALHVGQLGIEGSVIEETSNDVTSVVETMATSMSEVALMMSGM